MIWVHKLFNRPFFVVFFWKRVNYFYYDFLFILWYNLKRARSNCLRLKPEVLTSPQTSVFDYVDIIDNHPEYPALVHLYFESQVMYFSIFESVWVDQCPVDLTRLWVDLELFLIQRVSKSRVLWVLTLRKEIPQTCAIVWIMALLIFWSFRLRLWWLL